MSFRFLSLFTVEVSHAYYGGRCRDFRFLVPADTRRRLAGGRLLAKELDGALHVLFEASDAGEPRRRIGGTQLRFGLRLLNSHLGNFTQLPSGFPARKLHLANAPDPALLTPRESPAFVGPLFTHLPTGVARPVTMTLRDAAGDTVETRTVQPGETPTSFDLRGRPSGSLSVREEYPDATTATVPYYHDPELHRLDAVGVVEVEVADAFYADAPRFEVDLQAREEVLSYYLVARNYSGADFAQLEVSDEGFGEDGRPEIVFEKVPPESFTAAEISPSLLGGAGDSVVLFRSQAPLARQERGRRRLQLSRQNDVLIPNLPQPGADRAKADLIIHLSKP